MGSLRGWCQQCRPTRATRRKWSLSIPVNAQKYLFATAFTASNERLAIRCSIYVLVRFASVFGKRDPTLVV
jgi:hypothetical protein